MKGDWVVSVLVVVLSALAVTLAVVLTVAR